MDFLSKYFDNFDNRENIYTFTAEHWNGLISGLEKDIQEIRELFYNKSVETIKKSKHDIDIVNRKIDGKAEIVTKAFQLTNLINFLPRYIQPSERKEFSNILFHKVSGKQFDKCYDFAVSYMECGKSSSDKRKLFFSADITKYIYGYSSNAPPLSFPCLSSYISNGVPREILIRANITNSTLLIFSLVPKLTRATIIALALCFGDKEFAKEIKSELI